MTCGTGINSVKCHLYHNAYMYHMYYTMTMTNTTKRLNRTRRCRVDSGCRHATNDLPDSPCWKCQHSCEGFGDQFERNVPLPMSEEGERLFRAMHGIPQEK